MDINVEYLKKVLNLTEEEFALYGEMLSELNELKDDEDLDLRKCVWKCEDVYSDIIHNVKFSILFYTRKYVKFVKKHMDILTIMMGNSRRDFINLIIPYDYLKECYENKEEILKRLDKLLELNISEFTFLSESEDFSNSFGYDKGLYFEIEKDSNNRKGFFTDGDIEIKDQEFFAADKFGYQRECHNLIRDTYLSEVTGANYLLHFSTVGCWFQYRMQIKNLMFDIDTLPTLEEFENGVFPESVMEEIESLQDLANQKQGYIDAVYDLDNINDMVKKLLSMCEYYTKQCELTRCQKEAKAIKQKLSVLRELYSDVCMLSDALTNECFDNALMDGKELDRALTKKRLNSRGY